MKVTITVNEYEVHVSQAGKAGTSFDVGESDAELVNALHYMADYLYKQFKATK